MSGWKERQKMTWMLEWCFDNDLPYNEEENRQKAEEAYNKEENPRCKPFGVGGIGTYYE